MILRRIWNWIRINYSGGSIIVTYEIDKISNWEHIRQNFKSEAIKRKDDLDIFIGVEEDLIVIARENPSIFRDPNGTIYLNGELTNGSQYYNLQIDISIGNFFHYFTMIWRGGVFIFTLLFLLSLPVTYDQAIPMLIILLVINSICWLITFYLKTQANSLKKNIVDVIGR